ncbi:hypothetical protein [uncultured Megasphaera sp.]|uniref:hypothetical protein n=1 Tax=uncultured Megasphaera sp. TaxID=165188 RepID=UPI002587B2CD|nr:hypothetical protein [uncultured Megasphaera sp.]
MSFYEDLVMKTQMNYNKYYRLYMMGRTPYELSDKPCAPYKEQIAALIEKINTADCVIVGGASGLSAAGGGDFYYEDSPSFRQYFGKFAKKYGFAGAFNGMQYPYATREEFWAYLATFLYTTQHAPVRQPYKDLDVLIRDKDFHILTTNQDTQFIKLYPEAKVSEIQGDHRFFQCARPCCDDTWDALQPIEEIIKATGDNLSIPSDMIPRCPHCGGEAFPWVRGYGNYLQGTKYEEEYAKISQYVQAHADAKILFLELGVGRLTPMFIQEPFWNLTLNLPQAYYVSVNDRYAFLPKDIEDKGFVIHGDLAEVLHDAADAMVNRKTN